MNWANTGLVFSHIFSDAPPACDLHAVTLGAGMFGVGLMLGFALGWFIMVQVTSPPAGQE
jgi:hypothetical protein